MKPEVDKISSRWQEANLCAAILAVNPHGIGGLLLHAGSGPVREAWLQLVRDLLPSPSKIRRLPLNIGDDRLIGGLDLSRTLTRGKPVLDSGILAEVDQGLLVIPSAERLDVSRTAKIVRAMDRGCVELERDGLSSRLSTRFGVIALNEAKEGEEEPPLALSERLALSISLHGLRMKDIVHDTSLSAKIKNASLLLEKIELPEDLAQPICHIAQALGIFSIRAPLQTIAIARILAALQDEITVTQKHIETAVRLVLSPRATCVPKDQEDTHERTEQEPPPPDPQKPESQNNDSENETPNVLPNDFEILLSAALAAIPQHLLQKFQEHGLRGRPTTGNGKAGAQQKSKQRGRPCGIRRGNVRNGEVLNLIETLRAAAPLQTLRRQLSPFFVKQEKKQTLIDVRPEDFRISQYKKRKNTTTIFVVDASGSSALHRLAEVKGAIEMILSECYIRRDNVALIAFRGTSAEMLLPPTRSLTRAQRCIAALPGGGGTPLARAIDMAGLLATSEKKKGISPTIVFLTDGKANIDREGKAGRKTAIPDALCAGQSLRNLRIPSLLIDSSPRSNKEAQHIATCMGARYIPLPHANSSQLAKAVFTSQSLSKDSLV